MGLTEQLSAAGCQPRKTSAVDFFEQHPGLFEEVREAAAQFSYRQIHRLLADGYGWQLDLETLRRFMERK